MSDSLRNAASSCPVCQGAVGGKPFLSRDHAPALLNLPCADFTRARNAPRADLRFHACGSCGFVWNAAFDAAKAAYDASYDNAQAYSRVFDAHMEGALKYLDEKEELSGKIVVEIGCGQGDFLRRLARRIEGGICFGFDPAYRGPKCRLNPPEALVSWRQDGDKNGEGVMIYFYAAVADKDTVGFQADLTISRHVIEHVPDPCDFLATLAGLTRAGGKLCLETPDVGWILEHSAFHDFYHEHCSLFTPGSLARAVEASGFRVEEIEKRFGGQYLWLTARKAPPAAEAARLFGESEARLLAHMRERLKEYDQRGGMVLWGAGAKGVAFANALDPERRYFKALVDINPGKQGKYVPVTGHRIVSPEDLSAMGIKTLLFLNPNYRDEIAAKAHELGLTAEIADLSENIGSTDSKSSMESGIGKAGA